MSQIAVDMRGRRARINFSHRQEEFEVGWATWVDVVASCNHVGVAFIGHPLLCLLINGLAQAEVQLIVVLHLAALLIHVGSRKV